MVKRAGYARSRSLGVLQMLLASCFFVRHLLHTLLETRQ